MTTINSVSLTYFGLVGRKLKPTANKFVLIRFRLIFKIKRLTVYHNSSQVVSNLANRHHMNGICCSYVHTPITKHGYLTARPSWMSVHHATTRACTNSERLTHFSLIKTLI